MYQISLNMKKLAPVVFITVLMLSCQSRNEMYRSPKYHHIMNANNKEGYTFCIIPVASLLYDGKKYFRDTMTCCYPVEDLYCHLNIKYTSKKSFARAIFEHTYLDIPINISPELFADLRDDIIVVDDDIHTIYQKEGIEGVLVLLSTKEIFYWYYKDYERFKYIAYLCWKNDIFFFDNVLTETEEVNIPEKFDITGNRKWLKPYKSLAVEEMWH